MNWIDYKKLLNEEFKIDIESDNYDDKWMRDYNDKWMGINSDDPSSVVSSGRLTTAPQRPNPASQYLNKERYTPLRKRFLTTKGNASLKKKPLSKNLEGRNLKD